MKTELHYKIMKHLAPLAAEIAKPHLPSDTAFIPVPTSDNRLRMRGFNQTTIIASEMGNIFGIPVFDILHKNSSEAPQSAKNRTERLKIDSSLFSLKKNSKLPPTRFPVTLVDDICTTGSTLKACAHFLAAHGYTTITALALFRGKRKIEQKNTTYEAQPAQLLHPPEEQHPPD